MAFFYVCRNASGECKVYSTEREPNTREATSGGENMALVHINITSEMTGTGIQRRLMEINELITGSLLNIAEIIQCHITTQSWV